MLVSVGFAYALLAVASTAGQHPLSERQPQCAAGTVIHNATGCTSAGNYASPSASSPAACCALCAANATCFAWTFHPSGADIGACDLTTVPRVVTNPDTKAATCGCRTADCSPAPPAPPGPCEPVVRPPRPTPAPLPPGITKQPHIISMLIDGALRTRNLLLSSTCPDANTATGNSAPLLVLVFPFRGGSPHLLCKSACSSPAGLQSGLPTIPPTLLIGP